MGDAAVNKSSCTIVIPAHNEERVIADSVRIILNVLKESNRTWKIIVVDDGSADSTVDRAAAALGENGTVIRLTPCRGKAGAIVEGVFACSTELLLFTDADLSVPPEFFEQAAAAVENADVAIASRHLAGSRLLKRQPWLRETCGEIFRIMVQRFFLPGVSDFTCGLKAFRTDQARILFLDLSCLDWTFDVELLLRAKARRLRMVELPVSWSNRPDSRVRLLSAIVGSLRSLWKLRQIYGVRKS